jgi:hypothetical protein
MIFLIILCFLLFAYSCFISFHAYRWAKIIFSLEDKYSEALDIVSRTRDGINNILNMQMFFDSPSVKKIVEEVKEDLKVSEMALSKIVFTLTEHSKKKYIIEEE